MPCNAQKPRFLQEHPDRGEATRIIDRDLLARVVVNIIYHLERPKLTLKPRPEDSGKPCPSNGPGYYRAYLYSTAVPTHGGLLDDSSSIVAYD